MKRESWSSMLKLLGSNKAIKGALSWAWLEKVKILHSEIFVGAVKLTESDILVYIIWFSRGISWTSEDTKIIINSTVLRINAATSPL